MVNYISNAIKAYIIGICCLSWSCVLGKELKEYFSSNEREQNDQDFGPTVKIGPGHERHMNDLGVTSHEYGQNRDVRYFVSDINPLGALQGVTEQKANEQNEPRGTRRRRDERENLCLKDCDCKYEHNFLTVDCTFRQVIRHTA